MSIIIKYIIANKFVGIAVAYFALSIFLKLVFSFDILIPCIWKKIFHFECPGCGLTRACLKLATFDLSGAYDANPLIFIILPSIIFYLFKDFNKFKEKTKNETNNTIQDK